MPAALLPSKLLALEDPAGGRRVVRTVYHRDAIYSGAYVENAAELQVGMEDGYRVSWQTALGGTPEGVVYENRKRWSGDHGGFDYVTVPGVVISNRPLAEDRQRAASILDIAPTVLKYFGLTVPADIDGKPLY